MFFTFFLLTPCIRERKIIIVIISVALFIIQMLYRHWLVNCMIPARKVSLINLRARAQG